MIVLTRATLIKAVLCVLASVAVAAGGGYLAGYDSGFGAATAPGPESALTIPAGRSEIDRPMADADTSRSTAPGAEALYRPLDPAEVREAVVHVPLTLTDTLLVRDTVVVRDTLVVGGLAVRDTVRVGYRLADGHRIIAPQSVLVTPTRVDIRAYDPNERRWALQQYAVPVPRWGAGVDLVARLETAGADSLRTIRLGAEFEVRRGGLRVQTGPYWDPVRGGFGAGATLRLRVLGPKR